VQLEPGSPIAQFIDQCKCKSIWSTFLTTTYPYTKAKTPLERAKLLDDTPLFKGIHAETASTGQTAPPKDLKVDKHFTCFVEAPDASVRSSAGGEYSTRLIELDGRRDEPMDHGPVEDFLKVRNIRYVFQTLKLVADCLLRSRSACSFVNFRR